MSHNSSYNGVGCYWLAAGYPSGTYYVWYVYYNGIVSYGGYGSSNAGVRPVVKLPASIIGTVGETIEIN